MPPGNMGPGGFFPQQGGYQPPMSMIPPGGNPMPPMFTGPPMGGAPQMGGGPPMGAMPPGMPPNMPPLPFQPIAGGMNPPMPMGSMPGNVLHLQ